MVTIVADGLFLKLYVFFWMSYCCLVCSWWSIEVALWSASGICTKYFDLVPFLLFLRCSYRLFCLFRLRFNYIRCACFLIFSPGLRILGLCLDFTRLCYLFLLWIVCRPYCTICLGCSLHICILRIIFHMQSWQFVVESPCFARHGAHQQCWLIGNRTGQRGRLHVCGCFLVQTSSMMATNNPEAYWLWLNNWTGNYIPTINC